MLSKAVLTGEKSNRIMLAGAGLFLLCIALFSFTGNFIFLGVPFVLAGLLWVTLDWKSFYWFFLFSIPLSAEIHLGGSLATTVPDEPMMWLFVLVLIMVIANNYKRIPVWFLKHPITLIMALQFIWLLVAVGFSQNYLLSFKFLAAKIWFLCSYIILPVLIIRKKSDIVKAFLLFSIPALLHAVVVFVWHFFLNFDYWSSNDVVRPFYQNHVDHATLVSMMFPAMLICYQLTKGKKWANRLSLAMVIFLIPAIYVTGARAAMLGVIFSLVIGFAIRKKLVNFVMPAFFIFAASMVFYLSHNYTFVKYRPVMQYTATQRTFGDLLTATFKGTDMSSMERFYRWIASSRMSMDHPIVGVGPNNFYDHYKAHASSMFKTWVWRNEEKSTTHNYFFLMLVEQGWPAMILYGLLVITVLACAQRLYYKARDPFYKKVTMGLVMMFAAGFINNFFSELLETHKIGAMFFMTISLLIIVDHLVTKQNAELDKAQKPETLS